MFHPGDCDKYWTKYLHLHPRDVHQWCDIKIVTCLSSSLLSIVPDDDISVRFRPLRALLVGERIVPFEI